MDYKSFVHAYKYILQAKHWLTGDLIFIKKLSLFLLEIGEKEKAVDLSQYLLPSLAIHSILLEPFLKELEKKNELDYWIQQNSSQLKKLDKNTKQSLDALLVKVREKIPT